MQQNFAWKTYVDILPSRRMSVTPSPTPQVWAVHSDFLSRRTAWKRKETNKFTVGPTSDQGLSTGDPSHFGVYTTLVVYTLGVTFVDDTFPLWSKSPQIITPV